MPGARDEFNPDTNILSCRGAWTQAFYVPGRLNAVETWSMPRSCQVRGPPKRYRRTS